MNLSVVIAQLRNVATFFNQNVAGAAAFANGVEDHVWLPLPAAYVVPVESAATENEEETGLYQIVSRRFKVIVVVDNAISAADRRGQAAVEAQDSIEPAIFSALLNWRPDPTRSTKGIYKVSDGLVDFDRARLFYEYEFGLDETITDADGWQLPSVPLIGVEGTIVTNNVTIMPINVTLPISPPE